MQKSSALFVLTASVLLAACTLVPAKPGAENVTQVKAEHVSNCVKLGASKALVMDKAGFIQRAPEAIAENLVSLAKNSAVEMGGDTVVAASPITEGKQTFDVYKCRK